MLRLPYFTALHCSISVELMQKKTFSKTRVEVSYRNIFSLPKQSSPMYANHNICNFETTLRKNTFGFMQKIEQNTNTIINTILIMDC